MGYALGRLEEVPCEHAALPFLKYDQQPQQPPQFMGHVVSVALYPRFRGLGAAQALMNKLHFSMAEHYHVDAVNLFCRVSIVMCTIGLLSPVVMPLKLSVPRIRLVHNVTTTYILY